MATATHSLRNHANACIPWAHFDAVQDFEAAHPKLFVNSLAPCQEGGPRGGFYFQSLVFDELISVPAYAVELNRLIAKHPMQFAVTKQVAPTYHHSVSRSDYARKMMVRYVEPEAVVDVTVLQPARVPGRMHRKPQK
jgi:hypothetical protein